MEYCSDLKRKEIVIYAVIWVNLEDIMLSELSQKQKDISYDSTYMSTESSPIHRVRK